MRERPQIEITKFLKAIKRIKYTFEWEKDKSDQELARKLLDEGIEAYWKKNLEYADNSTTSDQDPDKDNGSKGTKPLKRSSYYVKESYFAKELPECILKKYPKMVEKHGKLLWFHIKSTK